MSFVVNAVFEYPNGRLGGNKHRIRWWWAAKALAWTYVYGPILMPLAGGAQVIDVFILEEGVSDGL